MSVSREELYEAIWAAPTGTAAAKYGVSGSFLARVCESLTAPPHPESGGGRTDGRKGPPDDNSADDPMDFCLTRGATDMTIRAARTRWE